MKKLLKFAAPILILALLFASCDDKGSTPSESGITAVITLPVQNGYPESSGWQAYMIGEDGEYMQAKSVSFSPVRGTAGFEGYQAPTLTASGFPSKPAAGAVAVVYTSTMGGSLYAGTADASGIGSTLRGVVNQGEFINITPQSVTLTLSGPTPTSASDIVSLPEDESQYSVSIQPSSGKAVAVESFTVSNAKAGSYTSSTGTPSSAKLSFKADAALLIALSGASPAAAGSPSVSGATVNIQFTTGTGAAQKTYATSQGSVDLTLGGPAVTESPAAFAPVAFGSIKATLPKTANGQPQSSSNPYLIATECSYELTDSNGNVLSSSESQKLTVSGDGTAAAPSAGYEFTIPNIKTGLSNLTLAVTLVSGDATYKGSASISGPTAESTNAAITAMTEQVAALTVKVSGTGLPISSDNYNAVLYNVDESGLIIGSSAAEIALDSNTFTSASATGATITVKDLEVGKLYAVSVTITPQAGDPQTKTGMLKNETTTSTNTIALSGFSFAAADAGGEEDSPEVKYTVNCTVSNPTWDAGASEISAWSEVTECAITCSNPSGLTIELSSKALKITGSNLTAEQLNFGNTIALTGTVTGSSGAKNISSATVTFTKPGSGTEVTTAAVSITME